MFEWDVLKNRSNRLKHGIAPADVLTVSDDDRRLVFPDTRRDYGEHRFVIIGSAKARVVTVVFVHRANAIRIISARLSSKRERIVYERGHYH